MELVEVNEEAVRRALTGMDNLPWSYGAQAASPFKKISAFATNFVIHQPIATPFPEKHFEKLYGYQNAIVAYHLSIYSLHNAVIDCPFRKKVVLKNRIKVSYHFWQEFVLALSQSNPVEHFDFVSLIFESICYESNPYASYKNLMENSVSGKPVFNVGD